MILIEYRVGISSPLYSSLLKKKRAKPFGRSNQLIQFSALVVTVHHICFAET